MIPFVRDCFPNAPPPNLFAGAAIQGHHAERVGLRRRRSTHATPPPRTATWTSPPVSARTIAPPAALGAVILRVALPTLTASSAVVTGFLAFIGIVLRRWIDGNGRLHEYELAPDDGRR